MRFQTGISLWEDPLQNLVVVAAVSWFDNVPTQFSTRRFTFKHAKDNLLSTVVVYNKNRIAAVNAACHRTVETLIVRKWTSPGDTPRIELLVRPFLAKQQFILPSLRTKNHWLLNAADAVSQAWLRGER